MTYRFNGWVAGEYFGWARAGEDVWKEPLSWNKKQAKAKGPRPKVICDIDWLDAGIDLKDWIDLLRLTHQTPELDWIFISLQPGRFGYRIRDAKRLLMARLHATTDSGSRLLQSQDCYRFFLKEVMAEPLDKLVPKVKEYEDILEMIAAWTCSDFEERDDEPPKNIWMATTFSTQAEADERMGPLMEQPAYVHALLIEPLKEAIHLENGYMANAGTVTSDFANRLEQYHDWERGWRQRAGLWVYCAGGDTPVHPQWLRKLRDECKDAKVPFYFAGWGEHAPWDIRHFTPAKHPATIKLRTRMMPDGKFMEAGTPLTRDGMDAYQRNGFYMIQVGADKSGRLLDGHELLEEPMQPLQINRPA